MRSNYRRIGDFIELVKEKNTSFKYTELLGINIDKFFMPSVANVVGANMANYQVVRKGQFACNRMHVGRDYRIPIALSRNTEPFIVSPAYDVFEITNTNELNEEYLMMWFSRPEFDRNAWFYTDADVRGGLAWEAFCNMQLPVPSIEKQEEIVAEYNTVVNRIKLNEQLNQKLEETAQAIYKHWFVEYEFPISKEQAAEMGKPELEGQPYKSSGGKMVWCEELKKEVPEGWEVKRIKNVAHLKYGKMLDSSLFLDSGFPVFSGYGIRGYSNEYMYEEPQILVVCRGVSGTGEVRLSPKQSYITNLSIIVEIKNHIVSKEYYYYYLKYDNLAALDSGSAQSQITTGDLGFHQTLIPHQKVQNFFAIKAKVIHNFLNSNQQSGSKLKELESTILSKMTKVEEEREVV
ncbi:MAG: restriction endonuclease subunit S [Cyclobacteriaceae bacterium]